MIMMVSVMDVHVRHIGVGSGTPWMMGRNVQDGIFQVRATIRDHDEARPTSTYAGSSWNHIFAANLLR